MALSIAPMMEWTDRHYRFLTRMLTAQTTLYTEMVVAEDVMKKDGVGLDSLIQFSPEEHPIALQLGGSNPETLGSATAKSLAGAKYDEINLNCGCPSSIVTSNERQFGARLMHDPELVRRCVSAMSRVSGGIPVTVKCRLGTNERNGYQLLHDFVNTVSHESGVRHFVLHAREGILDKLTPKQNRKIPPLRPMWAHRLQADFPHLTFAVNGGINSLEMAARHLRGRDSSCSTPSMRCSSTRGFAGGVFCGAAGQYGSYAGLKEVIHTGREDPLDFEWGDLPPVAGVMIGREAYNRPWMLREVDTTFFGAARNPDFSRREMLERYVEYGEEFLDLYQRRGHEISTRTLLKPLLMLFSSEHCGRAWRRRMDKEWVDRGYVGKRGTGFRDLLEASMGDVPPEVLDLRPSDIPAGLDPGPYAHGNGGGGSSSSGGGGDAGEGDCCGGGGGGGERGAEGGGGVGRGGGGGEEGGGRVEGEECKAGGGGEGGGGGGGDGGGGGAGEHCMAAGGNSALAVGACRAAGDLAAGGSGAAVESRQSPAAPTAAAGGGDCSGAAEETAAGGVRTVGSVLDCCGGIFLADSGVPAAGGGCRASTDQSCN